MVFGGTALWIFGTVFVTETPLALTPLPAGVSSTGGLWYAAYSLFSSTANVNLAMATFDVCFASLGVIGVIGFAHPILHSRIGKQTPRIAQSQGPVSPAGLPGRVAQREGSGPGRTDRAEGSRQASAAPFKDPVDYLQ